MRPWTAPTLVASLLVTSVFLFLAATVDVAASGGSNPRSLMEQQPGRQRLVGKRPAARTITSRLPSKARASVGGGDGDTRGAICGNDFATPPKTEVFGFFPSTRWVELHRPHVFADLLVETCHDYWNPQGGQESSYTYVLRDPAGRKLAEETGSSFRFDFPPDAPLGDYLLAIEGASLEPIQLTVDTYRGPRLTLTDPNTQADVTVKIGADELPVGPDGVDLHVFGFEPDSELEIGLYLMADYESWDLVDSWLVAADEVGEHQESLRFTSATTPGEYMLTACAVDDCALSFSILSMDPFGRGNAIRVPPMAWELFHLAGQAQSEQSTAMLPAPYAYNFKRCASPCKDASAAVAGPAPAGSTALYFQWQYEDIPPGAQYVRTWRVRGQGEWIRYECTWQGPTRGTQRIGLTEPAGLYSGVWEVTVTVDGQRILRETVRVAGNGTYWDPAGVIAGCQ